MSTCFINRRFQKNAEILPLTFFNQKKLQFNNLQLFAFVLTVHSGSNG